MKEQSSGLVLSQTDFNKLSALINSIQSDATELLEEELGRAAIVVDDSLPSDVVAMNSKVSFQDAETGKESAIVLVYPHDSNIEENKVSILTPVGSALIGLRVGQMIQWPFPNGKMRQLKVVSVCGRLLN